MVAHVLVGEIRVRLEFRQQHSKFESDPNFLFTEAIHSACTRYRASRVATAIGALVAFAARKATGRP
jgi:hypothetical protein